MFGYREERISDSAALAPNSCADGSTAASTITSTHKIPCVILATGGAGASADVATTRGMLAAGEVDAIPVGADDAQLLLAASVFRHRVFVPVNAGAAFVARSSTCIATACAVVPTLEGRVVLVETAFRIDWDTHIAAALGVVRAVIVESVSRTNSEPASDYQVKYRVRQVRGLGLYAQTVLVARNLEQRCRLGFKAGLVPRRRIAGLVSLGERAHSQTNRYYSSHEHGLKTGKRSPLAQIFSRD